MLRKRHAIHKRHIDVRQYQIRLIHIKKFQRLLAVCGFPDHLKTVFSPLHRITDQHTF